MAESSGQLDNTIDIVTPENIAFRYHVAGPFRRLPAYLLDLVIRVVVAIVVLIGCTIAFAAVGLGDTGLGLGLLAWFALEWFYGGLFETFWNGQTPGKRVFHLRVMTVDGRPIAAWQAILRNVLRVIDAQPFHLYLLGLGTSACNRRYQRLGDLATGTMVVVEEPHWFRGVMRIEDREVLKLAAQIPRSFQATRSLSKALAAYVQRRPHFPALRRLEIARHLAEPLRERLGLPPDTNPDVLLCALYQHTFISDQSDDKPSESRVPAQPDSPFAFQTSTAPANLPGIPTGETAGRA